MINKNTSVHATDASMAGAGAYAEQDSQTRQQLAAVEKSVATLGEIVEHLEDRLQPVLRPHPQVDEIAQPDEVTVPMACSLAAVSLQARGIGRRLAFLLETLDL